MIEEEVNATVVETIELNQIYLYEANDYLPSIDQADFDQQSLPELIARVEGIPTRAELRALAHDELLRTMQSVRSDRQPATALHVLLLADEQSRADIAAALSCEPAVLEPVLLALAQEKIVRCSLKDGWIHYSIAKPSVVVSEQRGAIPSS